MDNLSYIGGFIDGEGCFSLGSSPARYEYRGKMYGPYAVHFPTLTIYNTNREVLEFIQGCLDGGHLSSRNKGGNRKDEVALRFGAQREVLRICRILLPHLRVKRQLAELMIEWCESRLSRPRKKIIQDIKGRIVAFARSKPYTARELEIVEAFYTLNHRGKARQHLQSHFHLKEPILAHQA